MESDNKGKVRSQVGASRLSKLLTNSPYLSAFVASDLMQGEPVAVGGGSGRQLTLAEKLKEAGIDIAQFDTLQSHELDRSLKRNFGGVFLFLTALFTAASYAIVVLNAVLKWDIPEHSITALIIETPLQFIGLLYIIARNLFPQSRR